MFNRWLTFYLRSSIHVAFAAVALASLNGRYLNKSVSFNYLGWLFCATLLFYTGLKYIAPLWLGRMQNKRTQRMFLLMLLMAALGWFYFFSFFTAMQYVGVSIAIFLGLSYARFPSSFFSRKNGLIKTLIVALVWALLTVILIHSHWQELTVSVWIQFVATIFWILALMLPFELRDVAEDQLVYDTIAQRLGGQKSHLLAQGILILWFFAMLALPLDESQKIALIINYLLAVAIIARGMQPDRAFFVALWVEALPILGLLVYDVVHLLI